MYVSSVIAVAIVLTVTLMPPTRELAYLDPGSGSFLIQLLIGVLIGSMVFLRKYWSQLRSFLSRAVKKNPVPSERAQEGSAQEDAS